MLTHDEEVRKLSSKVICENCDGSGKAVDPETNEVIDDPICNGEGFIEVDDDD
jgi:hypothetical protein